jgi:hypothetical protein
MLLILTDALEQPGKSLMVFIGSGGVIKACRYDEDQVTELYNQEGNVVATVKETPEQIKMNAGSGL